MYYSPSMKNPDSLTLAETLLTQIERKLGGNLFARHRRGADRQLTTTWRKVGDELAIAMESHEKYVRAMQASEAQLTKAIADACGKLGTTMGSLAESLANGAPVANDGTEETTEESITA